MAKKSDEIKIKKLPCGKEIQLESDLKIEQKLTQAKERLQNYIQKNNLNFSEQRWTIAQALLKFKQHYSAQDIVKVIQDKFPEIGTATVYRSIKFLVEAHVLKETLMDEQGNVVYEAYDDEHHDHVVCLDCGVVFEFHSESIEKAQKDVLKNMGFREEKHHHVLYSRCNSL